METKAFKFGTIAKGFLESDFGTNPKKIFMHKHEIGNVQQRTGNFASDTVYLVKKRLFPMSLNLGCVHSMELSFLFLFL